MKPRRVLSTLSIMLLLLVICGCATIRDSGRVGTLRVTGSNVFLNNKPAGIGSVVRLGDELSTGQNSSALLEFTDGGYIQLDENTDPIFTWLEQGKCLFIRIFKGQAFLKKERACIEGPNVQLVLNSEVNMVAEPGLWTITVVKGTATIQKPKPLALLGSQQARVTKRGFEGKVRTLSPDELRAVVKWRDRYRFPLPEIERSRPAMGFPGRRTRESEQPPKEIPPKPGDTATPPAAPTNVTPLD